YDKAKQIYEQVINNYSETEAGIIAWKLLDFINSIEKERQETEKSRLSIIEKAKKAYLLMDFRNAIKNYSIFLSQPQSIDKEVEARFFKGRSHEEIGETDEALLEYRAVIKKDLSKKWAREANRRLLMLGEFYEQQKDIAEEAKRQLEAYQDEVLIKNIETYKKMVGAITLKDELLTKTKEKNDSESSDSIIKMIDEIGNLDLMGTKEDSLKQEESAKKIYHDRSTLSKAEMRELKRREYLAAHPFRRPAAIKELIDENISELRYLYNKRLKAGIKISGKMIVEIHISSDGTISKTVAVQSELGDPDFENSVLEQIGRWKFKPVPDSLGTLIIKYPFEFNEEM
ncbi:MAG: TonB family protein, partial [Chitinispirillaceae bacterium]|nr:TonB family protein [Chitinispirillaceae bacterium]